MTNFEQAKGELEDYLCTISFGGKVTGILEDSSIGVSAGASYSHSEIANALTNAKAGAKTAAIDYVTSKFKNSMLGSLFQSGGDLLKKYNSYNRENRTLTSTVQSYDSSNTTSISLTLTLVKGFGGIDSWQSVANTVFKWTQPKINGNELSPPNDVDLISLNTNPKGLDNKLASIIIGHWFHSKGVFWITDATLSLSSIVDEEGSPISGTLNVSLQSYRVLDSGMLASFYTN